MAELMDRYVEVADRDPSTRKANEYYIRRVIKPDFGHLNVLTLIIDPAGRQPASRLTGFV